MNQEPQPQPQQPQPRKGMSKGCLIALIVVGVLVVLVIILGIVCYAYKDNLVKMGIEQMVNGFKARAASEQVPGIDTVRVNGICDGFVERFNQEEEIDYTRFASFGEELKDMGGDDQLDSADVEMFLNALIRFYPDLAEEYPQPEEPDTLMLDTAGEY